MPHNLTFLRARRVGSIACKLHIFLQLQEHGASRHAVDVVSSLPGSTGEPPRAARLARHANAAQELYLRLKFLQGARTACSQGLEQDRARDPLTKVVVPEALVSRTRDCGQDAVVVHGVAQPSCAIFNVSGLNPRIRTANDR